MHRRPALRRSVTIAVVVLGVAATQAACGTDAGPAAATVVAVLDGRTVEVEQDGASTTVTLGGLVAPAPDECLGEDSVAALVDLLPVGTQVRVEPSDPASGDEVVAAVYADDVLVNAEVARVGLAFAAPTGDIATQVEAAQQEAVRSAAGLFGVDASCTLPAQVAAFEEATAETADAAAALAAGVGIAEVDRHDARLAAAAATGAALVTLLDGAQSAGYPAAMVASLRSRTVAVNERLADVSTAVGELRVSEEQRIEAERVAAEAAAAAEAARQAQAAADAAAAPAKRQAVTAQAPAQSAIGSVSYPNCDAVRAAGADPIHAGEPGYSSKLDRDGDGVACER